MQFAQPPVHVGPSSIASTVIVTYCRVPMFEPIIHVVDLRSPGATHDHDQMDDVADRVDIVPVIEKAPHLYETRVGPAASATS